VAAELAGALRRAEKVYFDLSDQLSGRLGGGGGARGLARILQEFFAAVTTPGSDHRVTVMHAKDQLVDAARLTSSQR
jgi:hypothetical protein